jgi:hypothetical protein
VLLSSVDIALQRSHVRVFSIFRAETVFRDGVEWWFVAACIGLPFNEVGWEHLLIGCFVSDSCAV